jgi:pantetheine-phosphate adenylyltransferase
MKKTALYPGTFDPVTYGHLDVIERSSQLFNNVIVAVAASSSKKTLFTVEERVDMLKKSTSKIKNIKISSFNSLMIDYAKKVGADIIVRGLRAVSDFEFEFQMALTNRKIADNITTLFLMPHEKYTYLNSTLVREIASFKGNVSDFVPAYVKKQLQKKFTTY